MCLGVDDGAGGKLLPEFRKLDHCTKQIVGFGLSG